MIIEHIQGVLQGEILPIVIYEDDALCAACAGSCCKRLPGPALPSDFREPLTESLADAFTSGDWAIDWWEGDPRNDHDEIARCYFVRPAVRGMAGVFDPSWGGECCRLTPTGCELPLADRPSGCRALQPKPDRANCVQHYPDKRQAAIAWLPHCASILAAAERVGALEPGEEQMLETFAERLQWLAQIDPWSMPAPDGY